MHDTSLESDELRRYSRQMVLPAVGVEGQERLKAARVLLVGVGGLGSPAALYLAAAGVGTLGLIDADTVEVSNLHRQVLYGSADLGRPKVERAAERLGDLNPYVKILTYAERLDSTNAERLILGYDLVIDGSDNFATRYLVNDVCVRTATPDVWGAVLHFEGQVSIFGTADGPCYRCLFPEPPPAGLVPSCAEGGVLGVLPGIIGSIQAAEAIKLLLGHGSPLVGRFLRVDATTMRFRELSLAKNPDCPGCSPGATAQPGAYVDPATRQCADQAAAEQPASGDTAMADASQDPSELPLQIDVAQLNAWRETGHEHRLLDVREPMEHQICHIEGAELIPLGELPKRLDKLDKSATYVVHCHHGPRSLHATRLLRSKGLAATNLAGGIDDWSLRIDSSVPRY